LLCDLAAFQDWDGVYVYSYQHGSDNWNSERIQSYFDINGNPAKLALLATGAMIFRRQDLKPGVKQITAGKDSNLVRGMALQHRVGAKLDSESAIRDIAEGNGKRFASDTGELQWDASNEKEASFLIDTPKTKLAMGFIAPGKAALEGLQMKLGSTSTGFGLVAVTSLDNMPLASSRRMLATTMANTSNKGMQWNESRTSVSDRWGTAPAMVEMVPANITIERAQSEAADSWKAYALDPTGRRKAPLSLEIQRHALQLELTAAEETVWYEIVCER
jgi:hypothetical protein